MFTVYLPTKIVFDQEASQRLRAELSALYAERLLLVLDPIVARQEWGERLAVEIQDWGYEVARFTSINTNPTSDEVTAGLEVGRERGVQAVVALGGGSVIDVGKTIAMLLTNGGSCNDYLNGKKSIERGMCPYLAVPTTAGAGSEVCRSAVIIDPVTSSPKSIRHRLMFPDVALLSPELTRSLPPDMTAACGVNAFVHALEAYLGKHANPFVDQMAIAALQTIWTFLPRVVEDGEDMVARQAVLLASSWGGIAMDQAGQGLIEALSGTLSAHLRCHPGLANAMLLPHVMRFNLPAISAARNQRLKRLLGLEIDIPDEELVERLAQFFYYLNLPVDLRQLGTGLDGYDWDAIAAEAAQSDVLGNNPAPVSAADCRVILDQVLP